MKFDIWEEADYELGEETTAAGDNCDDNNDMIDAGDLEAGNKDQFDDNLGYTQHPLVVTKKIVSQKVFKLIVHI